MRNAGLEEAQAGIKIAGRNINNLTYSDDTTLMALSMGFSRQGHGSALPFPPPGDHPNSGIKPESPVSPALQADSLPTEPSGKSRVPDRVEVLFAI